VQRAQAIGPDGSQRRGRVELGEDERGSTAASSICGVKLVFPLVQSEHTPHTISARVVMVVETEALSLPGEVLTDFVVLSQSDGFTRDRAKSRRAPSGPAR